MKNTKDDGMKLPSFTDPPVSETVLSVQFAPVQPLVTTHFGKFWELVAQRFPTFQIRPPLSPIRERFDGGASVAITDTEFPRPPHVRIWFVGPDEVNLLQLQSDRLILNWRRLDESHSYPRYSVIRPQFELEWRHLCSFCEEHRFGSPQVEQCEVSYINHIVRIGEGGLALQPEQITHLISERVSAPAKLVRRNTNVEATFDFPDATGRLHVSLKPGQRRSDLSEVFVLELTARGIPKGSTPEEIFQWLDVGHEKIVSSFVDLTTVEMHERWGREA